MRNGPERKAIDALPTEGLLVLAEWDRARRNPKLNDHRQAEARKRVKPGESLRTIAKTFGVHHATIARLAG